MRRRRQCLVCNERFTTFEVAELVMPRVIKSDEVREPFNEDKLRRGMLKALEKRPVSSDDVENALNHIKSQLRATGEREVPTKLVGNLVMDALKSWIRSPIFASRRCTAASKTCASSAKRLPACKTKGSFMYHDEFYMARAFELARLGRLPPRPIRTSAALSCATAKLSVKAIICAPASRTRKCTRCAWRATRRAAPPPMSRSSRAAITAARRPVPMRWWPPA